MSMIYKKIKKIAKITLVTTGVAFIGMKILASMKKPYSQYENEPNQKNPLEGKKVVFVENEDDKENADGKKGHLEAIGESEYNPGIYDKYIKRGIDIVLSFGGLVILSPVFAALSIAIYIDDPGPILFTQKRLGQNKKYFKLHKFRSMKMSTPHDVPTHMLENPEQYITKVGKFLRAHSLDELPQIWDIFIGNMSVIGPRPGLWNQDVLTAERDKYNANDVKPGLTGWAQINGRDELEIPDKAKLDGEYVQNMGPMMDAKVFLGSLHVFGKDDSVVEGGTGEMKKQLDSDEDELVSIIMPSYNTAMYIKETIHSVINQTYQNWELIIVDDCSDDNTDEVVESIGEKRIKYLKNQKNCGAAISRNRALKEAKGKWIAFLDSDDLWNPDKLEKQMAFMKKNNYHFSYTNYVEIDEENCPNGVLVTGPKKVSKLALYTFNYMGCLTVMYDREYVGDVQIENLEKRNDYAIWIKVAKKSPAYLLNEVLAQYRIRTSGSVMNRSKGPLDRMKYNYYLWAEGEKMNKVSAMVLTGVNLVFGTLKTIVFKKRM